MTTHEIKRGARHPWDKMTAKSSGTTKDKESSSRAGGGNVVVLD